MDYYQLAKLTHERNLREAMQNYRHNEAMQRHTPPTERVFAGELVNIVTRAALRWQAALSVFYTRLYRFGLPYQNERN